MRTNAGADFQCRVMGDSENISNVSGTPGSGGFRAANYIALTTNSTAPALTDTTLTDELVGNGLQRQLATYAHTEGATTYTLTKTFTSTDPTPRTINKVGIFNASTGGTLVFTTLVPSPPTLQANDKLTITETVSI
jgi:hypothetical protein